jgi:hypothetical protein
MGGHQPAQIVRSRRRDARRCGAGGIGNARGVLLQFSRVLSGARRGLPNQLAAFEQFARHLLPGVNLLDQVSPPRGEPVDPALDRVFVAAQRFDRERRLPAVVRRECHRLLAPRRVTGLPIQQRRRELVVSVGEYVRGHNHPLARDALDRESATIHLGTDSFDDDPVLKCRIERRRALLRGRGGGRSFVRGLLPAGRCECGFRGRVTFGHRSLSAISSQPSAISFSRSSQFWVSARST